MLRRHPSDEHKKSWEKNEAKILFYRSNIFMIMTSIALVLKLMTESTSYHKSMKFLDSDKPNFDTSVAK